MRSKVANINSVTAELRAFNQVFATVKYDINGKIISANPQFLRLMEYDLEELIGQGDLLFFSQSFQRKQQVMLWDKLRSGLSEEQTALWINKSGHELWLRSRYIPVNDCNGFVEFIVQVVEDVTEQQQREADDRGQVASINRAQAVVHFTIDGIIISANKVFLTMFNYDDSEVIGMQHSQLLQVGDYDEAQEINFWSHMSLGESRSGEYLRKSKDDDDIWLRAVYSPILDPAGRPIKIVMYAENITLQKLKQVDYEWQITAIHKSNIAVTFDTYGTVLEANDLFLSTTGYTLEEVVGNHHRVFVETTHAHGSDYAAFWSDLRQGKYRLGQYKRLRKDGSEFWLQATYNPIFDSSGKVVKIVKYGSEVTADRLIQADHQGQIAAINNVQCVISFDLTGTILDVNENFLAATGYRFADVRGHHHTMLLPKDYANSEEYIEFWAGLARGELRSGEYKCIRQDGSEIWMQATYTPILDMNGKPFKVVKYATDITADKLAEADYRGQIEAINKVQGVAVFRLDGTITHVNENFENIFSYNLEELINMHHSTLVERDVYTSSEYSDFWSELRKGISQTGLYKRLGKEGRVVWVQASYNPILDLNGIPAKVIQYATDVSDNVALAEAFEDANRQAHHDSATSLPNRVKLAHFMNAHLAGSEARMAVFYIDLDHFKPINDELGHHVGDRVLGEVADRIRRVLSEDQLVARVGGDEFVIAAPGMGAENVERFCRRLYEILDVPIIYDGQPLSIGMSIGVSLAPHDGNTPDELLRTADIALSVAKDNGRGQYSFFSNEMNETLTAQRKLSKDMKDGLTAGDFYLEYQPRFATRGRNIKSAEALVRWNHPEQGRIAPVDFIPLAEVNGLIIPLGDWILERACKDAAGWHGIGVSVNVSPIQFRDVNLIEKVKSVLEKTGLSADLLELEITEGVLLEDADRAVGVLNELKSLGVKLAMDDFGTGYSSLSYLRTFPFDVIKIDRSFMMDLHAVGSARSIIQAILGLGRAMGMSVTAEGVETNEQLAILTADNCDEVQGYLLARPLRTEQLIELLEEIPELRTGAFDQAVTAMA